MQFVNPTPLPNDDDQHNDEQNWFYDDEQPDIGLLVGNIEQIGNPVKYIYADIEQFVHALIVLDFELRCNLENNIPEFCAISGIIPLSWSSNTFNAFLLNAVMNGLFNTR